MTTKYEVTLSTKPVFTIHDVDKLESVVCKNKTGWCDSFNTYSDIKDFIDSFSFQFYVTTPDFGKQDNGEYQYTKFIEGLGNFIQDDNGRWELMDEESIHEFGMIEVYFDNDGDVEVEWSASEVK